MPVSYTHLRSDLTAVSRLYDWHFIAETPEEAIRLGLEAGVDLQLYDFPHEDVYKRQMGDSSISLLFFLAGIGGFANLIINGRN